MTFYDSRAAAVFSFPRARAIADGQDTLKRIIGSTSLWCERKEGMAAAASLPFERPRKVQSSRLAPFLKSLGPALPTEPRRFLSIGCRLPQGRSVYKDNPFR